MPSREPIRCRMAACREKLGDGKAWSFYLINDADAPLGPALLDRVDYEWGGMGSSESAGVWVAGLGPGEHVLVWRDDGDAAEVRVDLSVVVRRDGHGVRLLFEFPVLYNKRRLPVVDGLGKAGWQVTASADGEPGG
jgi:hypothetical protein